VNRSVQGGQFCTPISPEQGQHCRPIHTNAKIEAGFLGAEAGGNRERDERTRDALERQGWKQMVVWECECGQTEQLANRLRLFLDDDDGE
jgi:G:T-mismatch repair DNA endonuclease (very short patch repair protein)